jgi:hypothetical protein
LGYIILEPPNEGGAHMTRAAICPTCGSDNPQHRNSKRSDDLGPLPCGDTWHDPPREHIDALRAERDALRKALKEAKEFIENQQLPDSEWERVLDLCVAALPSPGSPGEKEKLNRAPANLPADWNTDSSLETWFPLTAIKLRALQGERDALWEALTKTVARIEAIAEWHGSINCADLVAETDIRQTLAELETHLQQTLAALRSPGSPGPMS